MLALATQHAATRGSERQSRSGEAILQSRVLRSARGIYTDDEGSMHCSLHANMFPLAFGLVPADRQAKVADFVQSRGMACSVYRAVSAGGDYWGGQGRCRREIDDRQDRAKLVAHDRGRVTMTTEAWDVEFKKNLTWNHALGAAPANIISRFVLGVRPLEPGYARILIAPQPGTLKWVRGKVRLHGPVTAFLEG